ncbi:MAG: hypothetical protein CME17_04090 [Gemmatimonadetes bacterium]|nr:hypothetical protein [Gemmatimonadota bacterium]
MRSEHEIKQKVAEVEENLTVLLAYLHSRTKQFDWHGVEDAASDIRDNEAALKVLQWILGGKNNEWR